MSLTSAAPQPRLAWQFDGTTGPYIGSVSSTTSRGTLNYTTPGKYISALNIKNPSGSTSNSINWNFGTQTFSIDAGFSFSVWVRFNDLSYLVAIQQFITFYNGTSNSLRIQLNATQGLMQFQFTDSVSSKNTNMFTPTAGTWYHLALVGNAGNITVYVNGSTTYGPMAYVQSGITFDNASLGLATSFNGQPVTDADFDDFRVFNTALTATQVQSIYAAQGMPSRGVYSNIIGTSKTNFLGTPLFSQLSASAIASSVGAFSLRAVNGTTVKAVQVKRQSDSATQDFYADRLGNLLTAPVTGQTLVNWLGGSTGNVVTWYDQSGQGQHMNQTTASLQPIISLATSPPSILFTGNGTTRGQYFQNTIPFTFNFGTNYQYSIRVVVNNTVGGCLVYKGGPGFPWNSFGYKKWWLGTLNGGEATTGGYPSLVGNAEGYVYGQSAIAATKSSVTWSSSAFSSVVLYENASSVTVTYSRASARSDPNSYLYIGAGGNSAYYNGNLYELEIFSSTLSASDVTILG
jgi:hypothetical protein